MADSRNMQASVEMRPEPQKVAQMTWWSKQTTKIPTERDTPPGIGHKSCGKFVCRLGKEMAKRMLLTVAEGIGVAEIYSPPRVAQRAR